MTTSIPSPEVIAEAQRLYQHLVTRGYKPWDRMNAAQQEKYLVIAEAVLRREHEDWVRQQKLDTRVNSY